MVSQLGKIITFPGWEKGIDLLERLMDWKETNDLLTKANRYFDLGLLSENGRIYLPIDGRKTEINLTDFKVLRPLKLHENKKLEREPLELIEIDESALVEEDLV